MRSSANVGWVVDLRTDGEREMFVTDEELLAAMSSVVEASLDNRFGALQTDMDSRFGSLRADMESRFDAVDGRFEAMDNSVGSLQTDFTMLRKDMRTVKENVSTIKTELRGVWEDILRLDKRLTRQEQKEAR